MRMICLSLTLGLFTAHQTAAASCGGQNIFETMPETDRARLESAAHAVPFAQGNFWRAENGDQSLLLVGTYHLDDPRHDAIMTGLAPHITAATSVLVEAGDAEEAKLKQEIARNPALIVMPDHSLPDLLPAEDWDKLSAALRARGMPGVMAAKMQPWYVSVLLALPPCLIANLEAQTGLDHRIITHAEAAGIEVTALEPFDTVFRMFGMVTLEEQISMIRSSLALDDRAEDYLTSLSDAYFAGESRMVWELSRELALGQPGYSAEQVDADLAKMELVLMTKRNEAWIPVIEAAARKGPVFVAFGALHLPGETGVPQLLQNAGWTLTPFDPRP